MTVIANAVGGEEAQQFQHLSAIIPEALSWGERLAHGIPVLL
jgi:hypothetical protein